MDCFESLESVEGTTVSASKIKPINKDTVHRICSGQVVLNLAIAVKELVENSLDAGATIIEVRLREYGQELVEVLDNGAGVVEENFSGLTLKYYTSKLREFSDLLGVSTFGFRGEALSSLCALANLTVTTRHSSTELGTKITYDSKGIIKEKTPCARQVGTTVSLVNLFHTLPVRQKEFHRNIKREFNKMTQLLYAYCLVSEGVKITCTNQTAKGNKSTVVATQGGSVKDNISCVFGVKQLQSLLNFKPVYPESSMVVMKEKFFSDLENNKILKDSFAPDEVIDVGDIKSDNELELSEESSNDANEDSGLNKTLVNEPLKLETNTKSKKKESPNNAKNLPFQFDGYISTCVHGSGRSTTDRQFFYINSRPCEPHKVIKIVNEVYKQYNQHQNPFVYLDIKVKQSSVDVNVTPDKRKIFLDKENFLLDVIKSSLSHIFESIPSSLKLEKLSFVPKIENPEKILNDRPRVFSTFLSQFSSKTSKSEPNITVSNKVELKRKSETLDTYVKIKANRCESPEIDTESTFINSDTSLHNISDDIISFEESPEKCKNSNSNETLGMLPANIDNSQRSDSGVDVSELKEAVFLGYTSDLHLSQVVDIDEVLSKNERGEQKSRVHVTKTEVLLKKNSRKSDLSIDAQSPTKHDSIPIKNIGEDTSINVKNVSGDKPTEVKRVGRNMCNLNITIDQVKQQMLEDLNLRNLRKKNLEKVKFRSEINPVFNKKCEEELQKEISKDMFSMMKIIGQFNLGFIITQLEDDLFIVDQHATDEKYNFETLQKTTILSNQKLVVPQNLELTGVNERVLMDNLEVFKKNGFTFEINENAPPTKRVKLLTIPISKNHIFGKNDIEELLFMLKDAPQEICRPSRVQEMFASRACRKSVMIGTALSKNIMRKLIDHMGIIEQPWNCPHGRPTIRHLVNLALSYSS